MLVFQKSGEKQIPLTLQAAPQCPWITIICNLSMLHCLKSRKSADKVLPPGKLAGAAS